MPLIPAMFPSRRLFLAAAATFLVTQTAGVSANSGRDTIDVDARLSQRLLKEGATQRVYLRIGVKGRQSETATPRTPSNISLVLDRSGSMRGPKMQKAREAAKIAISRLGAGDIASVIMFDNKIDTIVDARPVSDPREFRSRIDTIRARGNTAIYAAVEEGARQIRRNKTSQRLNRIILVSDGLANVGPSKPEHFEALGQRLGGEGISVTTIGLGERYNEDLMSQLAATSDGNHAFARTAQDLTNFFNQEFDELLSVTGQEIEIIIRTRAGVTPLRTVGRQGRISGNETRLRLNQIYGTSEYSLQLELNVPASTASGIKDLVDVDVRYISSAGQHRTITRTVSAQFSASDADINASVDPTVMEPILELQARERSRQAIRLRDKGRIDEARKLLTENATQLELGQKKYRIKSKRLQQLQANSRKSAASIADKRKWNASRKQFRQEQSNSYGASTKY